MLSLFFRLGYQNISTNIFANVAMLWVLEHPWMCLILCIITVLKLQDARRLTSFRDFAATTSRNETAEKSSTRLWIWIFGTVTLTGSSDVQSTWTFTSAWTVSFTGSGPCSSSNALLSTPIEATGTKPSCEEIHARLVICGPLYYGLSSCQVLKSVFGGFTALHFECLLAYFSSWISSLMSWWFESGVLDNKIMYAKHWISRYRFGNHWLKQRQWSSEQYPQKKKILKH